MDQGIFCVAAEAGYRNSVGKKDGSDIVDADDEVKGSSGVSFLMRVSF